MVEPLLSTHALAGAQKTESSKLHYACIGKWFVPGMVCSMVYATQPFNHAKQLVMLRLSSSYLIRNNFSCHFLSLEISKNSISWDFFNRFPALAAVTTFPSVKTHTGFRISSWSVLLSSSAYLAASFKSDWWPDATACSSNSLTGLSFYSCLLIPCLYPFSPSVDITKKLG